MPRRKACPQSVLIATLKRDLVSALQALGHACETVELDHDPALGVRVVNLETDEWEPHQHDPAALTWRPALAHKVKTKRDKGLIAKVKRLAGTTNRTRQLLDQFYQLGPERREALARQVIATTKRRIASRPFPKRTKPP